MSSIDESIRKRISQLRHEKGWTQADVGAVIGRSASHVSDVENGKTELWPSELEELATKFRVNPLYLIAGIPKDICGFVELLMGMDSAKRKLVPRLFELNLQLMEVAKDWPFDEVEE